MSDITPAHEQRETLTVQVNIPAHAKRETTAIFEHSRKLLLAKPGACCHICQRKHTREEPLEAHHYPIERALAEVVDFGPHSILRRDFPHFDWKAFDRHPDPYTFVDDMTVNGLLLCKEHHTGKGEGVHTMPHPLWIAMRYAREGYKFSDVETIHHHNYVA